VLERDWDDLTNPSARIVVGKLGGAGTGAFDVLAPVVVFDPLKEENDEEAMDIDEDVQAATQEDVVIPETPVKKKKKEKKKHRKDEE